MLAVNLEKNSRDPKLAWLAATLVTLAAVAERAWLLFSTPLVPGINGAYYLVQARALLEQGKLGIPDLPLTFWVDAALAKLIQLVSGTSLEASIILAVKLEDSILPALVALPVFALVRRWSSRVGGGLWLPTCAALAVACGAPALGMVGDFQKNSLGLVWLAALLWRLHIWPRPPWRGPRRTPWRRPVPRSRPAPAGRGEASKPWPPGSTDPSPRRPLPVHGGSVAIAFSNAQAPRPTREPQPRTPPDPHRSRSAPHRPE